MSEEKNNGRIIIHQIDHSMEKVVEPFHSEEYDKLVYEADERIRKGKIAMAEAALHSKDFICI